MWLWGTVMFGVTRWPCPGHSAGGDAIHRNGNWEEGWKAPAQDISVLLDGFELSRSGRSPVSSTSGGGGTRWTNPVGTCRKPVTSCWSHPWSQKSDSLVPGHRAWCPLSCSLHSPQMELWSQDSEVVQWNEWVWGKSMQECLTPRAVQTQAAPGHSSLKLAGRWQACMLQSQPAVQAQLARLFRLYFCKVGGWGDSVLIEVMGILAFIPAERRCPMPWPCAGAGTGALGHSALLDMLLFQAYILLLNSSGRPQPLPSTGSYKPVQK